MSTGVTIIVSPARTAATTISAATKVGALFLSGVQFRRTHHSRVDERIIQRSPAFTTAPRHSIKVFFVDHVRPCQGGIDIFNLTD